MTSINIEENKKAIWEMAYYLSGSYWREEEEWEISQEEAFSMLLDALNQGEEPLEGRYSDFTFQDETYSSGWYYEVAQHRPGDLYPSPCLVFVTWSDEPGAVNSYSYRYL
jgi:hypothetical protein